MKRLITVAIHRPTWYRGLGPGQSKLLVKLGEPDGGKRCCLGFVGQRVGIPDAALENKCTPGSSGLEKYAKHFRGLVKSGYNECSDTCGMLMEANDDMLGTYVSGQAHMRKYFETEAEREVFLKKEAEAAGFRFIFTNSKVLTFIINELLPAGL